MTTDLADTARILRLNSDYAWAIDNAKIEDLLALFTSDGFFDLRPLGAEEIIEGTEPLRKMFTELIAEIDGCVHLMMNHVIDLAGDTATGRVYCHSYSLMPDGTRPEVLVVYEDSYTQAEGGWKFRSRVVSPLLEGSARAGERR